MVTALWLIYSVIAIAYPKRFDMDVMQLENDFSLIYLFFAVFFTGVLVMWFVPKVGARTYFRGTRRFDRQGEETRLNKVEDGFDAVEP